MKGREVYLCPPELQGTKEEEISINKSIRDFLSKNYIELESTQNSIKCLYNTPESLLLIKYNKNKSEKIVEIQMIPQKTTIPKELSDLLTSKGFVRIQK